MAVVTITDTTVDGQGTPPDAPTGLTTETEWDGVRLHWTNPTQRDVDYIEIWRATTNNRASATMVAQVKGNDYVDHSLETGTRYYWLRSISTTGVYSTDYHPASATGGVSGIPDQVDPTGAVDKDVLQYNSATNTWTRGSLRDGTRLAGAIEATQDTSFTFAPPVITSISGNNGFDISSSIGGTIGYGAQCSLTHVFGDTLASSNSSAAFAFKTANGTSATSGTNPITGAANTGPTAVVNNNTLGSINFNGYATTDYAQQIASRNQGGGLNALHSLQIQPYAKETFADAITNVTPTGVTRTAVTMTSIVITGTKGQFSCASTTLGIGQAVQITGTFGGTGSISGYASGNIYYIIATNGSTTFTLSDTKNGNPITTTTGTPSGITVTRNIVTFTYTALSAAPFSANALIQVSGITGLTDGTYVVVSSSTTQTIIGAVTTSVSLGGTPLLSIRDVTATGTGFRIRGFATATKLTAANRINFIDISAATSTHRSDTFTFQQGSSTTNHLVLDTSKATFTKPVVFPAYTVANLTGASPTLVGAVGWQVAVSDSPTYAGRMAYWSTTATAGWRYIDDNTAV